MQRLLLGALVACAALPVVTYGAQDSVESAAQHVEFRIPKPGEGQFVVDFAELLSADQVKQIDADATKLLRENATPIIVVTIPSMAAVGPGGMPIEAYAMMLFNQWGIGHKEINKQQWNTGILLLVAVGDRKARIELGAGWGHEKDTLCRQIMDEQIVPAFRQNDFSGGILAGVKSLDAMARGKPIPRPPRPWWHYALMVGAIGLGIFTVVSLVRQGASGWAWLFWGVVFAIVGAILISLLRNSGRSGGGFSGGSFGGGFSGGGGATGSW